MAELPLPIHSNRRGQSTQSRLRNCFAERSAVNAKNLVTLIGCPGVQADGTLPKTPYRGAGTINTRLMAVAGTSLYEIAPDYSTTEIGAIAGSGRVSMAENTDGLSIYTNAADYLYDGTTLSVITDPDKRTSHLVDVFEGYAVSIEENSGRFFTSQVDDSDDFDALDFSEAAFEPDNLVSLLVNRSRLILFGQGTLEMWFVQGGSGFPLARVPNGVAETGCIAELTPKTLAEGIYFVDQDRIVRTLSGINPQKISSHAIDDELERVTDPAAIVAFTYKFNGHSFYCLTTDRGTFIFDVTTGEWHERKSLHVDRWRVDDVVPAFNKQIAFDSQSGQFGRIDGDITTEFGESIRMDWTFPTVWAKGRVAKHNRLEISANVGEAAAGVEPVMGLEYSDDGGVTFIDIGPTRSLGKSGETFQRMDWTRLGSSRNRTYRGYISDAVRRLVVDANIEVQGGRL